MITKDYLITAAEGMHARPATNLVKLSKNYSSLISIKKGERTVKLSSLMNILSLGIKGGETISIIIDGEDEASAVIAIDAFFEEELKHL
ncbi:HPr family phosphocarrier protein [Mucilaginibacter sp. HC2]|uniref:HPr family phosphocarrier protein n=1 Tax=Mucilaginibacter inviolabilis TaxID=2714892 RepID=UPI001407EAA3|nr:HPr family phosphocarrier protein [Mucilaginibacter inviolabilis]NHA04602.1 HPr family phosphocarrier protein [Mucilaginibacter inviolabilis]